MNVMDRIAARFGYQRQPAAAQPPVRYRAAYAAAQMNRLTADWVTQILSPDVETAAALTNLRARSRALVNNNPHAKRVIHLMRQNVIGPDGIRLQARVTNDQDVLAKEVNQELERSFARWGRRANCMVDGRMSWAQFQQLAFVTAVTDGEVFIRKVPYGGNPYGFALQFIDADRIPVTLRRFPQMVGGQFTNEIRMGVEVDPWQRPVAYYVSKRHPSEGGGAMGAIYDRIPAREIIHFYVAGRPWQTRGVPWFHAAMLSMHMLGQYEEAELVASRLAACMGVFFTSKTGEEYAGVKDPATGAVEVTLEPGVAQQLPEGVSATPFNPTHPNQNFSEFEKRQLHGIFAGNNISYASGTGDLREVNFSSIRQGLLDERDGYRVAQSLMAEEVCEPVFGDWFDAAILSGQLRLPVPNDEQRLQLLESMTWHGRGWGWVDPLKDVQATILAIGAGLQTRTQACAERGVDFDDNLKQLAEEQAKAKELNVDLTDRIKKPVGTGAPADSPDSGSGSGDGGGQ